LAQVLKPIKETITMLEADTTTLADCYLGYIKIAAVIKTMPKDQHTMFYRTCVSIFNDRFKMYDYDEYLLTYYLHPKYRGKLINNYYFAT
jgi:hypothetical protein